MSILELKSIKKIYGNDENKVAAINNISLCVEKGDMIAVVGPSGSGKSTFLNIIGLLDQPTEGNYLINGKDVSKMKDKKLAKIRNEFFGFVVQNFALIDDYTIYQNIKVPLDYAKVSLKEKKQKINDMLSKMQISEKKDKLPNQLSGGQNQRVAIARALINNPEVILADEPTGALDKKTSQDIMNIFLELNKEGQTVIIITHDENIAKQCKKIILIEDGMLREN